MGRALFSIISLIALAVLIVLNIDMRASLNLFGWQFEEVAVPVLMIVSFVLGAVYAFLFYLLGYFSRSRKRRLERQKEKLKNQEQSVRQENQRLRKEKKGRDGELRDGATTHDPSQSQVVGATSRGGLPEPSTEAQASTKPKGKPAPANRGLRRFFGASSK